MKWVKNDGGREAAGFKGNTGDCVCRAIAIASGRPYREVYDVLAHGNATQKKTKRMAKTGKGVRTARVGIYVRRKWFKDYMDQLGFEWVSCMGFNEIDGKKVGTGCQVHLDEKELPSGRIIVSLSKHMSAVIDGVIHDTYDPNDRGATIYPNGFPEDQIPKTARRMENGNGWIYDPKRCVYGYWRLK
jgi:hypothetical protein